jgi:hypothetical protein
MADFEVQPENRQRRAHVAGDGFTPGVRRYAVMVDGPKVASKNRDAMVIESRQRENGPDGFLDIALNPRMSGSPRRKTGMLPEVKYRESCLENVPSVTVVE